MADFEKDFITACEEFIEESALSTLSEVSVDQVANLHSRAQAGLGIDDAGMRGYSPSYAAKRKASGRSTQPRTLTWSGRMLGSIHAEVDKDKKIATIGFSDAFSIEKAESTNRQTPWFGFSPHDLESIAEIIRRDK